MLITKNLEFIKNTKILKFGNLLPNPSNKESGTLLKFKISNH